MARGAIVGISRGATPIGRGEGLELLQRGIEIPPERQWVELAVTGSPMIRPALLAHRNPDAGHIIAARGGNRSDHPAIAYVK